MCDHVILNKIELITKSKSSEVAFDVLEVRFGFLKWMFSFRDGEHFMTNQLIRSTGHHRRQNGVLRSITFLLVAGKSQIDYDDSHIWLMIDQIGSNPIQNRIQYHPTSSKSQILPIFLPKRRHINQSQIRVMTANHKIDKHRVTKSNHVKQITIHHVIRLFWIFFGIWSVSMSPLLAPNGDFYSLA